ncbi:MAG: DUF805 domain-containing protein [Jatrophihabitans sp.]
MSFADAIRTVFGKYATFSGRARRSEFWWFALFAIIVDVVVGIIDSAVGNSILGLLVGLALVVPSLAVAVRRLHDTGRSGWWLLIGLIPIVGAIVLIVFYCQDSQAGANAHGNSPKEGASPVSKGYPAAPYQG